MKKERMRPLLLHYFNYLDFSCYVNEYLQFQVLLTTAGGHVLYLYMEVSPFHNV